MKESKDVLELPQSTMLQRDFKTFEASYWDDVLNLVVASSFLSKMIANQKIER